MQIEFSAKYNTIAGRLSHVHTESVEKPQLAMQTRLIPSVLCAIASILWLGGYDRSLTLDESVTLFWSYQAFHHQFSLLLQEIHTPSYDLLLGLWLSLAKFGVLQARLLSLVCALTAIAATYRLCLRYIGERSAIFAAALLAFSPLHVYYSQYARAYAFYIAASVVSSYYYFAVQESASRKNTWGYIAASYLLICSHIVGFTLLAAQWIHFFLPRTDGVVRNSRRWFGLQAILALLYSPILALILWRYNLAQDIPRIYFWVSKPTFGDLLNSLTFLSGSQIHLAVLLTALAATACFLSKKSERRRISYLLLWIFLPMLSLFSYSLLHHPIFIPRGFAPSAVPLLILAALALAKIKKSMPAWGLCVFAIALSSMAIRQNRFGEREDWQRAAKIIENNAAKHSVFVSPGFAARPLAFYLQPSCFYSAGFEDCLRSHNIYPADTFASIPEHITGKEHFWFAGYTVAREQNHEWLERLRREHKLTFTQHPADLASIELFSFSAVPAVK